MQNNYHAALSQLLRRGNCNLQFVPRLKNVAMDFPCCYAFIYSEICLCRKTTGIIFIGHPLHRVIMGILKKNKELKLATITNPAPVYLEQPSPIPASAAAD